MNAVQIVTIKSKKPIYKGEELANAIELIELEENGFDLIAGKELYQIGDKAVFIQPDFCVSDIPLFESFIRPINRKTNIPDEGSSYLGKVEGQPRRIRAKKFNFHRGDGLPIYSNGILLPYMEVNNYLNPDNKDMAELWKLNLTEKLGITKYEEPEVKDKHGMNVSGGKMFPIGVYKTDEENINNMWNHIEKHLQYPIHLIGTEKVDGSSITIGVRKGEGFICSRNLLKPLTIKKCTGKRNKTLMEYLMFWTKPDLNQYTIIPNDDDFIKYGKPYLDKLIAEGQNNIVFRGELNGGNLKGSGNKNNPASKEAVNIKFFGLDMFDKNDIAIKMPYDMLEYKCKKLGFNAVKEVINQKFTSKEEIIKTCNAYFENNMTEGIVLRTPDSKFSTKFMSLEYDSKK